MQETQLRSWTIRVLQASLEDTGRLNRLLSEASQFAMSTLLLRSTGAGQVLGAGWVWRSMGSLVQRRRAEVLKNWHLQVKAEIDSSREKFGKACIPREVVKSILCTEGWKGRILDMRK